MNFELRTLKSTDVFPMATIVSKIGLAEFTNVLDEESIKTIASSAKAKGKNKAEAQWLAGATLTTKLANVVLSNLAKCEDDINGLLASVSGLTQKEIEELPIDAYLELVVAFIKKPEFKSFLSVASKLLG